MPQHSQTTRTQLNNAGASRGQRRYREPSAPGRRYRPTRPTTALIVAAAVFAASTVGLSPRSALAGPATGRLSSQVNSAADVGLRPLVADVVNAGVPGVIARVQDGHQIHAVTAGVADLATGAKLRPQARFRVGSITKTFIATVVLQLVGQGRLRLDEPVARTLPGLLANGDRITVRQLLNHTSGLYDYTQDPTLLAGVVRNQIFKPRELVALAERHPSVFPPGTAWAYSNTDFIVAGMLVEAVTGHRLGQELQERIFRPLRLENTSFPVTSAVIPAYHANGYVSTEFFPTSDGRPYDVTGLNPSAAWAAGALISTAADLSAFYRALMTGTLLTPHLLREMTTTVAEDPADPNYFRYGLGIERVQDPCGANWGHGGAIFGYQDIAYWNEQTGRTVVIASTMWPSPAAAEAALTNVTDYALCGVPAPKPR